MTKQQQQQQARVLRTNDLKKVINAKVMEYMSKGWSLCWEEQGGTYLPCFDLEKDDERIRIGFADMRRTSKTRRGGLVFSIKKIEGRFHNPVMTIEEKTYLVFDRDNNDEKLYTDDVEFFEKVRKVRVGRGDYRYTEKYKEAHKMTATDKLVKLVRRYAGFKTATKKTLLVEHNFIENAYNVYSKGGKKLSFRLKTSR